MKAELGRALHMGGSQLCSEGDELDVEALGCKAQSRRGQDGVADAGGNEVLASLARDGTEEQQEQAAGAVWNSPVHWQQHATCPASAAPGEASLVTGRQVSRRLPCVLICHALE